MDLKIADNFSLPLEFVTGTEAILGRKGSGKSHTASVMAEELLQAGQQIIVIDPTDAWWGLRAGRDATHQGYPVAVLGGDHADVPLESGAGKEVAAALVASRASAILSTGDFGNAEACRFTADFLNELFRLQSKDKNPVKLIIDEADAIAPERPLGAEMLSQGAAQKIVRRGRSRGIGCLMITQRPQQLAKSVLSQADMLVLMRLSHPRDIGAVEEWVRVQADEKQADEVMAALPALPVGAGYLWHPDKGLLTRVTFRRRRTFDSGATPKANEVKAQPGPLKPVDIQSLGAAITKAAEEAKANDPAELRKKIAQLEAATPNSEDRGYAAGYDEGYAAARREKEGWLAPAEVENARAEANARGVRAMAGRIKERITGSLAGLAEEFARIEAGELWPQEAQRDDEDRDPRRHDPDIRGELPPAPPETRHNYDFASMVSQGLAERGVRVAAAQHPKGELAVLTALAQHAKTGCSREQLSLLCGYKRSTRDRYIQLLMQKRHATDMQGRIWITPEGMKALGPNYQPLPQGSRLRQYWLDRLPQGEKLIFEHVIKHYPASVTRERLSKLTNYKRSTRDRYIQLLQAREIIERGGGAVKAKAELFKG